jgi:hypothetical protein
MAQQYHSQVLVARRDPSSQLVSTQRRRSRRRKKKKNVPTNLVSYDEQIKPPLWNQFPWRTTGTGVRMADREIMLSCLTAQRLNYFSVCPQSDKPLKVIYL